MAKDREDKVIRDPVHNYIPVDSFTRKLLDTPEVQRLRYISQLGVSSFAYPGACHTRLSHAIGTYHLMNAAIRHLENGSPVSEELDDHCAQALRAAALLHDIGHGPFSHLLEDFFNITHEDRSCQLMEDTGTEVGRILKEEGLTEKVSSLISKSSQPPFWQKSLIDSQLDVDRMDYLLRDSHFTGAGYGRFDSYRLLNIMTVASETEHEGQEELMRPVWPRKAVAALEEYIFARYHMYVAVYHHKTTRGYEKLLEAILNRAAYLAKADSDPPCEPDMELLLGDENVPNDRFCRMSDATVLSALCRWIDSPDCVLSDLCRRFLNRDGFKSIALSPKKVSLVIDRRSEQIRSYMESLGNCYSQSVESYVLYDKGCIDPYSPYKWGSTKDHPPILVWADGAPEDIADVLPRLQAITEEGVFERYYCPAECRDRIDAILND